MQPVVSVILAFLQAHNILSGSITIWMVLSLAVNIALALKGPAAWEAYAEKNPTAALIINILFRVFGIDIVGLVEHIQAWLNSKANSNPAEKK